MLQRLQITPTSWLVRYKETGLDGNTFDASCYVSSCLDDTIEIHMASVNKFAESSSSFVQMLKDSRSFFKDLGFKKCRYMRNGEIVEEDL